MQQCKLALPGLILLVYITQNLSNVIKKTFFEPKLSIKFYTFLEQTKVCKISCENLNENILRI